LNRTAFDAFTLMASPVRGLRPLRAARFVTPKVPKPISWTFWFFFSDAVMVATKLSNVLLAAALLQPADSEMTEIRCSLSLTPAGVALGALGRAFFGVEADFALVDRFAGARAMMSSSPECGVFLNLDNSSRICSQWLRYRNGISRSFPFGQASFFPERCEALIQMSDEKSLFIKKR
jgi:hypothetical protein